MNKTAIFHITGGLGKHVLSSSVINSYKRAFPERDIIVSSAYPTIFERNPNVIESLDLHRNQYFYKNYIYKKDVEIFAHEPYKETSHILRKTNLIDTWCKMIGINNTDKPSLHFSFREREIAAKLISQYQNKPIFIFQPFGGPPNQEQGYSWARDIHPELAQTIVDRLHEKYNVLHICNPQHVKLKNCIRVEERLHPHILFLLLAFAERRLLIDSCLHHAAYAMGLPCTVIWNVTSSTQFGYDFHRNIQPLEPIREGTSLSYLFDYEITGLVPECPYSSYKEMFNIEAIFQIIDNEFLSISK